MVGTATGASRSWGGTDQSTQMTIKAATAAARKKILYIDNLDPEETAESLTVFVRNLGVEVISCFVAQPRKRFRDARVHSTSGQLDRKAFRLGIFERDVDKLCDSMLWPCGISISEWQFKRRAVNREHVANNGIGDNNSLATSSAAMDNHNAVSHTSSRQPSEISASPVSREERTSPRRMMQGSSPAAEFADAMEAVETADDMESTLILNSTLLGNNSALANN